MSRGSSDCLLRLCRPMHCACLKRQLNAVEPMRIDCAMFWLQAVRLREGHFCRAANRESNNALLCQRGGAAALFWIQFDLKGKHESSKDIGLWPRRPGGVGTAA